MASAQHPPSSNHSLAFRVMRLCRPSFQAEDAVLRVDPFDLFAGEDLFDDPSLSPSLLQNSIAKDDLSFRDRFQLHNPTDAIALPGLLMVPQSFGAIYLGETFCSYVSVNNSSSVETRDVVIKAEIQTEKQRILLFSTKLPIESIRAGGRHDFVVEHDVKELGPHTLVCTALYNDGESERKYLPQFFKFVVANPLSVRTKVRAVKDKTFLEACIENHTKSNLFMDQVEFEPSQSWDATILKADELHSNGTPLTREIFKPPLSIKAGGGTQNYVYQLTQNLHESGQIKVEGSNILGKLQITWRTNLGEPGRLQTQHILGTTITQKEIDFQVIEFPSVIVLERPFLVRWSLKNQSERTLGPFEVCISQEDAVEDRGVIVNGLQKLVLPYVEAFGSTEFSLNMISTRSGVQKISGITVFDPQEKRMHGPLEEVEIFVGSS